MGNCQAADAATVVIQHPAGRVEKLYWPVSAVEIMRSNPGHYVAHVTLGVPEEKIDSNGVRFTRVKLLRPKDTLLLGQVYRLVSSQEVMKGLRAKKQGKLKSPSVSIEQQKTNREHSYSFEQQKMNREHSSLRVTEYRQVETEMKQVTTQDTQGSKTTQSAVRPRQWRPSLQSISEIGI